MCLGRLGKQRGSSVLSSMTQDGVPETILPVKGSCSSCKKEGDISLEHPPPGVVEQSRALGFLRCFVTVLNPQRQICGLYCNELAKAYCPRQCPWILGGRWALRINRAPSREGHPLQH